MSEIERRLRAQARSLRIKPTPLVELIPLLQQAADEVRRLNQHAMEEAVRYDGDPAYWRGQDEAVAGVAERWEQALTEPYPKAGVMNEPLEGLYRRTEELRRRNDQMQRVMDVVSNPGELIEAHMRVNRQGHLTGTSNWAYGLIRELVKAVKT
jgi:hypothetical protein